MASDKEASVVIFDVGRNTVTDNDDTKSPVKDESYFEKGKSCLEKIFQRKIFSRPKDEIGLILMGTDETKNNLNRTLFGYENIMELIDVSQPNWDIIRQIQYEIPEGSQSTADWVDALIVGMDFLKRHTEGKKFGSFKIVLMTTFTVPVDISNIRHVIEGLKVMDIDLVIISDNVKLQDPNDDELAVFQETSAHSNRLPNDEQLIRKIILETGGALCTFDEAIVQLIYFEKKAQKSMPWSVDLEFGTTLKIKINTYVYINDDKEIKFKLNVACGDDESMTTTKSSLEYYHNNEKIEPGAEDIIKGYMYGGEPVVLDDAYGTSFNFGSTALQVIGFTDYTNLREEYFAGNGVRAVVPNKLCKSSVRKYEALISVMNDMNTAMICRYVYRQKTRPKIVAIFINRQKNRKQSKGPRLLMSELFFANNFSFTGFPSLIQRKTEPSDDQLAAIDSLIDSMDLMEGNDQQVGCRESFVWNKILDPANQHKYRAMAFRALHPNQPLPDPQPDILDMFAVPKKLREQSEPHIAKIKELFELEHVKISKTEFFKKLRETSSAPSDVVGQQIISELVEDEKVVEVGTVTPADDFILLLLRGEKFTTVAGQLELVIFDLIFKAITIQMDKVVDTIQTYRNQAIQLDPQRYNDWIVDMKRSIMERNKLSVWQDVIVANQLGLISVTESAISKADENMAIEFYSSNLQSDSGIVTAAENDDFDNLLDNM